MWVSLVKRPSFDHAGFVELENVTIISIFWLKVNNDAVFEASVLEYDRYEPLKVQGPVPGTLSSDST